MNKQKEIVRLRRKLFKLWAKRVHEIYGNKCAVCGDASARLNAHHIEDRRNAILSFDLQNGILLCVRHHKFSKDAAHRSPVFFIKWLMDNDLRKFNYILERRDEKVELSYEMLLEIQKQLEN